MQSQVQYQHYIPQFILRNFSHTYKPPKGTWSRKQGRSRLGNGMRKGDKVLNIVDLTSDEPQPSKALVSRWFGQGNMYNDDATNAIKSRKSVEAELSKLESRAAEILQKVNKAHEKGEAGISLNRSERDRLRKFLFIMKYRGPGYYEKYLSGDPNSYQHEDKNLLRSYMAEKGFENPRDVWLHNLRAILDLDMDAEGKWMEKLPEVMFPADAAGFELHVQSSYTAFCTPKEEEDEFILTDRCYNVFEGPIIDSTNAATGEDAGPWSLCFHEFCPISPRLIIVLRSCLLPEALEDANHKIRYERQTLLEVAATHFPNPKNVKSILADLPVAKAMNSSLRVVNGQLELAPGETGKRRNSDKFSFRFWPIERRHLDIVNSIFLDNILHCKSVVFRTVPSFTRTLEEYMTASSYGFKTLGLGERGARVSRRTRLEKLSVVLKALGSNKAPIWHDAGEAEEQVYIQSIDDIWLDMIKKLEERSAAGECLFQHASPFWQTYRILGGTEVTFMKDLEQSWRLYQLQSLVFHLTQGLNHIYRRKAHAGVLDLILQFYPRRIWLYVKHSRWMRSDEYAMLQDNYIGPAPIFAAKSKALFRPEMEDEVVRVNANVSPRRLSCLIYAAGAFEVIPEVFLT